jgi:hypothetical protein
MARTYFCSPDFTQKLRDVSDIDNGLDRSLIRFQFSIITVLEIFLIKTFTPAPRTRKASSLIFLLSAASVGLLAKAAYDSHWLWKRAKENRELANEQLRTEID